MFTKYEEVVDYLYSQLPVYQRQGPSAYKPGLDKTFALCAELGNPQDNFKSIHVAGTNGKGSVSHMMSAIFQSSGRKVGLYTSPHLTDFTERIKINGKPISHDAIIDFVNEKKKIIDELQPTFFELTVAMSFYFFSQGEVDIAIIETGLGGRLDSTNVITPELSIITNIDLEHTETLGDNLADIAREKAGIMKPGIPVVIGETNPETKPVFLNRAEELESFITFADHEWQVMDKKYKQESGTEFWIQNRHNGRIEYYAIDSIAAYQQYNVITALESIYLYNISYPENSIEQHQIEYGLAHFSKLSGFEGRMQIIKKEPLVIVDVAHNPAGIKQSLYQIENFNRKTLYIMAFSSNKDIETILNLLPDEGFYYFCKFDSERSWNPRDYQDLIEQKCKNYSFYSDSKNAYLQALKDANPSDCIACLGSVFLVSEILIYNNGTGHI